MQWLTLTHTKRLHTQKRTIGHGHIYQGRYKSFIVQKDGYLLQLIRYVERNPVCAKLVRKGENWRWTSLWRRTHGSKQQRQLLADLPIDLPKDYLAWVNEAEPDETLVGIHASVNRGTPLGVGEWVAQLANRYDLAATMRGVGRPMKEYN